MKKLLFFLSAFVLAGCTVSEISDNIVDELSRNVVYTACFEDVETKVYVDTDLKTHWTADDRISIFTSTYNEEYRFDGQTGNTGGSFSVVEDKFHTGASVPTIYAVYPYDEGTAITSDGVITLNLPAVQNYSENSYGLGANTMVAVTESKSSKALNFKSVCGYIVVKLYGEGIVNSVTLTGNNGEKLAGLATITAVYGQAPAVVMSESATTSITIDCGGGVELGKTPETATSFWLAVPPVTFSQGFTIRVTNTAMWSMEKSTSAERTVTRNIKNPLSPLEVNFDIPGEGYIQFEDANFKAYCVQNFDTNEDGEISDEEGLSITQIIVDTDNITSLVGIEHFVNLEYLSCNGSWSNEKQTGLGKLTSLDVSNNLALTYLSCLRNQLSSLNVSNNTALTSLICGSNRLSSLNVSNNTALTTLACGYNRLTSLDVSNNTALTSLICADNRLSSLDISNNNALTALRCEVNQLTALDVSNNTALTSLLCASNRLPSLDVRNNTALTYLDCATNRLSSLNISNNTVLTRLFCSSNQLSALDISNNTALTYLYCDNNQLTSLDVSNNAALIQLVCSSNKLTTLDVSNNTALTQLVCTSNQLTVLDVSNNLALTRLSCSSNPYLTEIWLKTGQTISYIEYDTGIATIYYK